MEKTSPDFKGNITVTDHAASATWSKMIDYMSSVGNSGKIMDWPEGKDFGALPEKELCVQEAPPHKEFPEDERGMPYLVMDPAVWQETIRGRQVIEAAEGGESNHFAEVKAT